MTSLIALLVRHALMLCAGFFTAHGIDGSSSVGLITGLLMLVVVTAWSLAEKWLNLRPGQLTDSAILRTMVGALASQLVTAASAYFAVNANHPELLAVALLNAGLSKAGVHQKLATLGSGKAALLLLLSVSSMGSVGCSQLKDFVIQNEVMIEEGIIYGARLGVQAGVQRLKKSGKEPVNVQPHRSAGSIIIPRYGVQVAEALRSSHSSIPSF